LFTDIFDKDYANVAKEHTALLKFLENKRMIEEHNERYKKGLETFKMDVWRFSDRTPNEINEKMNGFVLPVQAKAKPLDKIDIVAPSSVNWTAKGYVTEGKAEEILRLTYLKLSLSVKNQKLCGSCWSFATVGAIEGQIFREKGVLRNLSEQNLIDCNRDDLSGNFGCSGGDMITAFDFVSLKQKGIALDDAYVYEANDTSKCRYKPSFTGGTISSYLTIVPGNEVLLKAMVAKYGPVACAVDASLATFQSYKSGVFYDRRCTTKINHAILVVGYGTDSRTKKDFWLIKNSYGRSWGDNG
jgi:cathepsin L